MWPLSPSGPRGAADANLPLAGTEGTPRVLAEGEAIGPGRSVQGVLGRGARGEVYLAWDERRQSRVAVKLVRLDKRGKKNAQAERPEWFRREAAALRLSHPHLVRVLEVVLDGPYPHLVLEYVEGPSLRRVVKKTGPLSAHELVPVGLQMARALHYLSAEGMVHCDVRPQNILITPPSVELEVEPWMNLRRLHLAKGLSIRALARRTGLRRSTVAEALRPSDGLKATLIDLGNARTLERAAKVRGFSPNWAYRRVPENGRLGMLGPAADVWALGATLHYAATGALPEAHSTTTRAEAFTTAIERHIPRTRPQVPFVRGKPARRLGELVASCLREEPSERPSALQLAVGLEALAGGPRL